MKHSVTPTPAANTAPSPPAPPVYIPPNTNVQKPVTNRVNYEHREQTSVRRNIARNESSLKVLSWKEYVEQQVTKKPEGIGRLATESFKDPK